ncbi:MAG: hypothetical protein IJ436_02200 [Bacteroidaceae bacterium]|nr:hypothetical protein [Bacteroidaceae bacterium]
MQFFKLWAMDSFGNINVPSSQAVLWLRTAIAVFFRKTLNRVSFFYIWHRPPLPVMLTCRTPRGYIFAVASRDHLLLALTNQSSAALWEK